VSILLPHRQAGALRDNYHVFALGNAFGLAFLSSQQLGFSAATGAFLAGVVIAGSKFSELIYRL
jgi:Kef-type K+ transport system membrane component KefB